jgi:integrase
VPRGAAVIRYEGKRKVTWYAKYQDATGRQVKERLGTETDGWTRQKAERELGKRLDRVEREHWRKPDRETFAAFAGRFRDDYLPGRNLKPSTVLDYESTLRLHLEPFFGDFELARLEPSHIDAYVAAKRGMLSSKTITNHLGLLRVMFKVALRWRLVSHNPLDLVDRPRIEQQEMNILTETEIARLLTAHGELEADATEGDRAWWRLSRRLTTVALGTALRRGELLALRWRDVRLLEGLLTVRESLVRGRFQTPKSRSSRRTMELGSYTSAALEEHWNDTSFRADEDLVFSHPQLGTPLDPSKLSRDFMRPALKKAGVEKAFRPWHDLRHTALTYEAAAGNPSVYVQLKAGHSQGTITERYIHAAQVLFPGAAERGEARIFSGVHSERGTKMGTNPDPETRSAEERRPVSRPSLAPRVGLEPTTLRLTAGCSAN